MENSDDEYLHSEIKIEEEKLERADTDDQDSTTSEDETASVDESCGPSNSETNSRIPITPKPKPADSLPLKPPPQEVITCCNMKNCTWSTKEKDRNLALSRLKFHVKLFHPKITDICETCFEMFEKKKFFEHICGDLTTLECKSGFDSKSELSSHVKSDHDVTQNSQGLNSRFSLVRSHSISNCLEKTARKEKTEFIDTSDSEENDLTCKLCHCNFFDAEKLQYHLKIFHLVSSDINMDTVNFETPLIKKFVCNTCNSIFTQRSKFKLHYYKMHKIVIPTLVVKYLNCVKYYCNLCPSRSRNYEITKLKQHYLDKHKKKLDFSEFDVSNWCSTLVSEFSKEEGKIIFTCPHCTDFYSTTEDLNRHKVEQHAEFCCSRCKMIFDTEKSLKIHTEEVHFGECKFCDFTTFNFIGLHVHVTNKHTEKLDVSDFSTIYRVQNVKDDAYHVCSLCHRCLSSQQNMKMHYFWFHNRFLCDFCNLTFSMISLEAEHFSSNHLTDCIHCKHSFSDFKELDSHLQTQHSNEIYSLCEYCGEDLKNREDMIEHRKIHENDKVQGSHLCSLCGFQCKKKKNLEQHIKMKHANTSELSEDFCKICQKKFKNITLHMHRSHGAKTQERKTKKQHKCYACDKVFYKVDRLKKHLTFHYQYKCTQCPMQFTYSRNLEQHVSELHTNRYAYSCTVCTKIFSTESDFKLHMKFHQGSDMKPDLLPVLRCELCDEFCLNWDAMYTHVKSRHIKNGKLVNVKRKKPPGRVPYIKKVKK